MHFNIKETCSAMLDAYESLCYIRNRIAADLISETDLVSKLKIVPQFIAACQASMEVHVRYREVSDYVYSTKEEFSKFRPRAGIGEVSNPDVKDRLQQYLECLDERSAAALTSGFKFINDLPDCSHDIFKGYAIQYKQERIRFENPQVISNEEADALPGRVKIAWLFHRLLLDTEIATIDACAENIILFASAMPADFCGDMTRQVEDEARHARQLMRMIEFHQGWYGMTEQDTRLRDSCNGLPLELRLCIHQRIGEWIGVEAGFQMVSMLERLGYNEAAREVELIVIDEIEHSKIGNRWIGRILSGDQQKMNDLEEAALKKRDEFGLRSDHKISNILESLAESAGFSPKAKALKPDTAKIKLLE